MSYIDHNPKVAWAMAFESGIRTQAAADMEEAGCKVQTSGTKSGGCYGDHYTPVYSAIRRMERDTPILAAVGHWLCLSDTGAANEHLDTVADAVLARFVESTPAWAEYRKARKERVEALVQARMMQERLDMDGSRPPWGPAAVCDFAAEWLGVKIVESQWQRDGWEVVWQRLGEILRDMEADAMEPIAEVSRATNKLMRAA